MKKRTVIDGKEYVFELQVEEADWAQNGLDIEGYTDCIHNDECIFCGHPEKKTDGYCGFYMGLLDKCPLENVIEVIDGFEIESVSLDGVKGTITKSHYETIDE